MPTFCCGAAFSWRFSCNCSDINWSFLTWRQFSCFKVSLFLLTSLANFSSHKQWTISQNALSCFTVDALRCIVRAAESSCSSRVHADLWFPLGHGILTMLRNALRCAGAAMDSGTLWWLFGCELLSFDIFVRSWLCCCLYKICVLVGCIVQAGLYRFSCGWTSVKACLVFVLRSLDGILSPPNTATLKACSLLTDVVSTL